MVWDWIDESFLAIVVGRFVLLRIVVLVFDEMHFGFCMEVFVVYGDVKPVNIIVGLIGGMVLVDFGLVCLVDSAGMVGCSNLYVVPELRVFDVQVILEGDAYVFVVIIVQVLIG